MTTHGRTKAQARRASRGSPAERRPKPRTIDDYLANVSEAHKASLEQLRRTIRDLVPEAEECISYGLAAFRLNGRPLIAFGATEHHCALYPMSSATVKA